MKILILGHGRHGKDTVAEILRDMIGLTFQSSSWAACEIAVFPWLSQIYGYETVQECYDDRAAHRMQWKSLITDYNTPDKSRLCRQILEKHDCYVGMRCPLEYAASRPLFDVVLWVDAFDRHPADPSMQILYNDEMTLVPNNGTVDELRDTLAMIVAWWRGEGRIPC